MAQTPDDILYAPLSKDVTYSPVNQPSDMVEAVVKYDRVVPEKTDADLLRDRIDAMKTRRTAIERELSDMNKAMTKLHERAREVAQDGDDIRNEIASKITYSEGRVESTTAKDIRNSKSMMFGETTIGWRYDSIAYGSDLEQLVDRVLLTVYDNKGDPSFQFFWQSDMKISVEVMQNYAHRAAAHVLVGSPYDIPESLVREWKRYSSFVPAKAVAEKKNLTGFVPALGMVKPVVDFNSDFGGPSAVESTSWFAPAGLSVLPETAMQWKTTMPAGAGPQPMPGSYGIINAIQAAPTRKVFYVNVDAPTDGEAVADEISRRGLSQTSDELIYAPLK